MPCSDLHAYADSLPWHFWHVEWIGFNRDKMARARGLHTLARGNKPWVARIDGAGGRFGLLRTFVDEYMDATGANRTGDRGIYLYFPLYEQTLYEYGYWRTRSSYDRGFVWHDGTQFHPIEKSEAEGWAKSISDRTS